jgi:hypothetical protein
LLDGQHVRVFHGLAQELHHRVKALEGVVHQAVVRAQVLEQAFARQVSRPARLVGLEAQLVGIGLVDQLGQANQVDRAVDLVERLRRQAELLQQEVRQVGRARAHHLQANRLAELARAHLRAQGLAQVGHVVFIDVDVRVPREAELRESLDLAPGEELVEVGTDDAGQQHEALVPRLHQRCRQRDDAWQHTGDAHDGDVVVTTESVGAAQAHDEVQRLVGDLREGVGRVQADGHQQRAHLAAKEVGHPLALVGVAVGVVEDVDAGLLKRRRDHLVEDLVLIFDQAVAFARHLVDVGRVDAGARGAGSLHHVGVAHLEELVEVGRDDADVAQALDERHVFALGLGQHTPVELQDGLLTGQELDARRGRNWTENGVFHAMMNRHKNARVFSLEEHAPLLDDNFVKRSAHDRSCDSLVSGRPPSWALPPPRPAAAPAGRPPTPSGAAPRCGPSRARPRAPPAPARHAPA